jgi:broad specificity phosphatase PhoE
MDKSFIDNTLPAAADVDDQDKRLQVDTLRRLEALSSRRHYGTGMMARLCKLKARLSNWLKIAVVLALWLWALNNYVAPVPKIAYKALAITGVAFALLIRPIVSLVRPLLSADKQREMLDRMPKRIVIVRHGESMGNVDRTTYGRVPDSKIELTERGHRQSFRAGRKLRDIIGNETVRFFVSPYRRTEQTFRGIVDGLGIQRDRYTLRVDPRLRECDWGNFQDVAEIERSIVERREFGAFFFRFPNGESGGDVYTRVDSFWSSLFREFEFRHCLENFVLVTHGITARLVLMRYFRWSIYLYHQLYNLRNCQIVVMELDRASGRYKLLTPLLRNRLPIDDDESRRSASDTESPFRRLERHSGSFILSPSGNSISDSLHRRSSSEADRELSTRSTRPRSPLAVYRAGAGSVVDDDHSKLN